MASQPSESGKPFTCFVTPDSMVDESTSLPVYPQVPFSRSVRINKRIVWMYRVLYRCSRRARITFNELRLNTAAAGLVQQQ